METIEKVKERPMLFSTPMVIAALEDRKDITRRLRGLEEINKSPDDWTLVQVGEYKTKRADGTQYEGFGALFQYNPEPKHVVDVPCPYGQAEDILWVRETWAVDWEIGENSRGEGPSPFFYKATDEHPFNPPYNKWKPSIHMPKRACRLKLEIMSIGVERLHDITEEDAMREGINKQFFHDRGIATTEGMEEFAAQGFYKRGFRILWSEINGPESWDANPWVWRISFRKQSKV